MPAQTLNLGNYKLSIPPRWRLNGKRDYIEEQIKRIFEESGFFEKIEPKKRDGGLAITRFYTKEGEHPFDTVEWEERNCKITNTDGSVVLEMKNAEVPKHFSPVASDIMISKYFRKAGVPELDDNGMQVFNKDGSPKTGPEKSAKQVIRRMTACWRYWGERYGYFKTTKDAEIFEDELTYMLVSQIGAPNTPQWFNTGLALAYGITGEPQGHYYVDPDSEELTRSADAYTHPQPHACFIQSIKDDLVNKGGIMDLWVREARIFKYGSGTGTNFSNIRGRGEPLSGGGTSSGLMTFLKIGDTAAGAIKSGGTTRRAAKMVCLDIDHPEVEQFITWKANEEKKVRALVLAGYSSDYEGEAYQTVAGQNSNNSVRIPHEFMRAVLDDKEWNLTQRTDGAVFRTVQAKHLWKKIAESAWASADPGIQYNGTINDWHTCPAAGPIRASNPCSEYMFLDDTACNLASLNLMRFFDQKTSVFDIPAYRHAIRLWTIVLEISVLMAQFPSKAIAQKSYDFRTLGLGYANLGTMLMVSGIPYDSEKARSITASLTAILTGESYATSAELASHIGAFPEYENNKEFMLRVIRNHKRAAYGVPVDKEAEAQFGAYEGLEIKPIPLNPEFCPADLLSAARSSWDKALRLGEEYGFRNAQTTVIAPTGTIGLLMDCDTTGVEPDFALVKFKKLAGGGYWKMPNQSIKPALLTLGYSENQISDIITYVVGCNSLDNQSTINRETLIKKGLTKETLEKIEHELQRVFQLHYAFTKYTLRDNVLALNDSNSNFLDALGFTEEEQRNANNIICGHHTIEGAPHLKSEHLKIFDCANICGNGVRFIDPMGHVKMLAVTQPFISGSISKTINMPGSASVEDIEKVYLESWRLGLKAVALYRDGSKLSQPLSTKQKEEKTPTLLIEKPPTQLSFIERGTKRELPQRRKGITIESNVAGHKIFLSTGQYEDETLGEIFISMHKEGSAFRNLFNCFAIAVSIGLQYGVPLKKFVDKFTFTRFEPNGVTDHPNIKTATSIIDFIFRVLGMEYLNRTDFVHVPPKHTAADELSGGDQLSAFNSTLMGDAPACSECGHITIRSGSCYRCLNCGASLGCS